MKFAIITHVPHIRSENKFHGYSAYVREMNIWSSYVDTLLIVAPISKEEPSAIHLPYEHSSIRFFKIPSMAFISLGTSLKTLLLLPLISYKIFQVMRAADHIHLRCPGTIGLMGCVIQMLFPKKPKTAKYAGNWDPKAKQPFSYRVQKKILSNTFFTKNMKVLVYGDWKDQTKNIYPFFTATYPSSESNGIVERTPKPPYKAMFVGTLSTGKRPMYALQLVAELEKAGMPIHLAIYGDGAERELLEGIVKDKKLEPLITFHGNQTSQVVKKAYRHSDFLILPSKSEGWPKVVAEAMFWGCVPIVTPISCVPWMVDYGTRGILLTLKLEEDVKHISNKLETFQLPEMSKKAQKWSQEYTIDAFKLEISNFFD